AGVVDHDVQASEPVDCRPDQRLDRRLVPDVRTHRQGLPASGFDIGDHLVRTGLARGVVDDDLRAVGRELPGNAGPDAFGCARYDGDLVLQPVHVSGFRMGGYRA